MPTKHVVLIRIITSMAFNVYVKAVSKSRRLMKICPKVRVVPALLSSASGSASYTSNAFLRYSSACKEPYSRNYKIRTQFLLRILHSLELHASSVFKAL